MRQRQWTRAFDEYRALFGVRGVPGLAVSALVAQLTLGTAPLGILLVTREATGSLALSGVVVAGFAVGAAAGRPLQGRLIDRRGPSRILLWAGLVHGVSLAAVAILAVAGAPSWSLIVVAAVAGLGEPSISASSRVLLGRMVPTQRDAAYALVTVTQELAILAGPALMGALIALTSAPDALVFFALVSSAGTFWYALLPPTRTMHEGAPSGAPVRLRDSGFIVALLIAFQFGVAIGAAEVAIPAFALERGTPAASGFLLGAISVGAVAGGLVLGTLTWSASAVARTTVLLAACGLGVACLAAASSLPVMVLLLVLAGLPLAPVATHIALLVDNQSPADATAEAFGWKVTAVSLGLAGGSVTAGPLAEHVGVQAAFLAGGAAAEVGAGIALVAGRRMLLAPAR